MSALPRKGAIEASAEDEVLVVLTNLPDRESAMKLATALVERRLAACVNVLGACTSVYRWQGAIEQAAEVPLVIKSTNACYERLEAAIRELHPYDLPEVVGIPVERGLEAYLDWVAAESRATAPHAP